MKEEDAVEIKIQYELLDRYTSTAEARIFVLFIFNCILFGVVCLLTFLNLGLPVGSSIPAFWYATLVHGVSIMATVWLIIIFSCDQGPVCTTNISNATPQRPVISGAKWIVLLVLYVFVLGVDGYVYVKRFIDAVNCTTQNESCVFQNSGSFWDWWGCIIGVALVIVDFVAMLYLKGYETNVELEYKGKREIQRVLEQEWATSRNSQYSALSEFTPATLRKRW